MGAVPTDTSSSGTFYLGKKQTLLQGSVSLIYCNPLASFHSLPTGPNQEIFLVLLMESNNVNCWNENSNYENMFFKSHN